MPKRAVNVNGLADSRLRQAALHSEHATGAFRLVWPAAAAGRTTARRAHPGRDVLGRAGRGRPAVPVLVVRTRRDDHTLHGGTTYHIGRDPQADIVIADSRVSWRHGQLRVDGDRWVLEDTGSTNGTFVGLQRVERVMITSDCVIRLGNPDDGPLLRCMPQAAAPAPGVLRDGPAHAAPHAPADPGPPTPVEPIEPIRPADPGPAACRYAASSGRDGRRPPAHAAAAIPPAAAPAPAAGLAAARPAASPAPPAPAPAGPAAANPASPANPAAPRPRRPRRPRRSRSATCPAWTSGPRPGCRCPSRRCASAAPRQQPGPA